MDTTSKDSCGKGHAFTPDNTYVVKDRYGKPIKRQCKTCNKKRWRNYYHTDQEFREAVLLKNREWALCNPERTSEHKRQWQLRHKADQLNSQTNS